MTPSNRGHCQVIEEWHTEYIGPGLSDGPTSMVIDNFGSVYVTGSSRGINTFYDFATVKYYTSGIQQWTARYSGGTGQGNTFAEAYSITVDNGGNTYVTGSAPPPGSNTQAKFTTIKYNPSGVQQWVAVYINNVVAINVPHSITNDYNSNVYVTGGSYFDTTGADYTTIKYDSSGVQQWVARYRNPGEDWANCVKVDNLGYVYVSGYSRGDTTYNDIATVKYNSSGVQQWVVRYNGPGNRGDSAIAMVVDNIGNVYVTGTSWGGASTGYDYITIKYNSSGVQQWCSRYNGSGNGTDIANSIAVDSFGNVYITGYTWSGSPNYWDFATIKYNSAGIQQWVMKYQNGSQDWAYSLVLDNSGNVYVTGMTNPVLRFHFATIKYSPDGVQQWVVISNVTEGGETPIGVAVDSIGNVYVAGGDGHYLTIKYNQLNAITPISNRVPDKYHLYQNYPNPFNPSTKIRFDVPANVKRETSNEKLIIFDILGREVATLVNEQLKPGSYEVEWDGSNFPSGLYFYRLTTDGSIVDTKKMILVK